MKAKPVLVIIGTLVLGFVLGMLTSAQLRFHRLKPVRMYSSEERFRDGFFKVIQPDEKQKASIEEVLDRYAKINSEIQGNFRKDLDESMNNMRKEIDSQLKKEQIARLREMDERRKEMIRQNRNMKDTLRRGEHGRYGNRSQYQGRPRPDGSGRPPQPPPGHDSL